MAGDPVKGLTVLMTAVKISRGYRCAKCKHSWNLTIYERKKPGKIPAEEYELFLENDEELALKYGNDMGFLKRNNAEFK